MKLNVYTIYDTATAAYMRPMFMDSDGQAMRIFSDVAVDAEHEIGKHPEDYSLVRIGVWDNATAKYAEEDKQTLITGLEAVANSRKIVKLPKEANGNA